MASLLLDEFEEGLSRLCLEYFTLVLAAARIAAVLGLMAPEKQPQGKSQTQAAALLAGFAAAGMERFGRRLAFAVGIVAFVAVVVAAAGFEVGRLAGAGAVVETICYYLVALKDYSKMDSDSALGLTLVRLVIGVGRWVGFGGLATHNSITIITRNYSAQ